MSENIILDPTNQQTRFYNLQAEATLSSLESNIDPAAIKDKYYFEYNLPASYIAFVMYHLSPWN